MFISVVQLVSVISSSVTLSILNLKYKERRGIESLMSDVE